MCFSAPASFAASAALLPAGTYCTRTAFRKNWGYLPLAVVPFFFSIQQFCEGLVWVGLGRDDAPLVQRASVIYLFFAIAFWPLWIPLSIWCTEARRGVRAILRILITLSLFYTWLYGPIALAPEHQLATGVVHHSIRYDFGNIPGFAIAPPAAWRLGYVVIVSTPLILGCTRDRETAGAGKLQLMAGLALLASFAVSYFVFWYAFTSVWCFLAAILALLLCYVFAQLPEASRGPDRRPA